MKSNLNFMLSKISRFYVGIIIFIISCINIYSKSSDFTLYYLQSNDYQGFLKLCSQNRELAIKNLVELSLPDTIPEQIYPRFEYGSYRKCPKTLEQLISSSIEYRVPINIASLKLKAYFWIINIYNDDTLDISNICNFYGWYGIVNDYNLARIDSNKRVTVVPENERLYDLKSFSENKDSYYRVKKHTSDLQFIDSSFAYWNSLCQQKGLKYLQSIAYSPLLKNRYRIVDCDSYDDSYLRKDLIENTLSAYSRISEGSCDRAIKRLINFIIPDTIDCQNIWLANRQDIDEYSKQTNTQKVHFLSLRMRVYDLILKIFNEESIYHACGNSSTIESVFKRKNIPEDSCNFSYYFIDTNGQIIYDYVNMDNLNISLTTDNKLSMDSTNKLMKTKNDIINEINHAFYVWSKEFKKHGLSYLRKNKIAPIPESRYKKILNSSIQEFINIKTKD